MPIAVNCASIPAEIPSQIHEWAQRFEPLWQERFDLLEEVVQELKKEEEGVSSDE